jgi:hypothetical protein
VDSTSAVVASIRRRIALTRVTRDPTLCELLDGISKLPGVEMTPGFTASTLVMPQDITLQEMRLDLPFPADDATEEAWRGLQAAFPG